MGCWETEKTTGEWLRVYRHEGQDWTRLMLVHRLESTLDPLSPTHSDVLAAQPNDCTEW